MKTVVPHKAESSSSSPGQVIHLPRQKNTFLQTPSKMYSKLFLLLSLALVYKVTALPTGSSDTVMARNEAGTALNYIYPDTTPKRNEAGTALNYIYNGDTVSKRDETGKALN
ncbi:hypothetical protein F5Y19DRAFT_474679 [Xylariaceae sp. FL1651]|nr:hypothetical protein F5Y19DRAFT_474679 [Xylariaceae sp. FL1651]